MKKAPKILPYQNSDQLCRYIADRAGSRCIISFSMGKDSIGAWIQARKYFHNITPVYYYLVPGLSFVEKSLTYYEEVFDTRIIRVPNPNIYRMLNNGTYQTPRTWNIIQQYSFPTVSFDDIFDYVKEDLQLPKNTWVAIGNRMFDSVNRYGSIKMYGAHNDKRHTFYPIYDYKIADLVKIIKDSGIKLPVDYTIWGKSFDGLDHRFIKPIRDHYPEDFEKIKSLFPLIETDIMRYEDK